jgi:hypothetical protein
MFNSVRDAAVFVQVVEAWRKVTEEEKDNGSERHYRQQIKYPSPTLLGVDTERPTLRWSVKAARLCCNE